MCIFFSLLDTERGKPPGPSTYPTRFRPVIQQHSISSPLFHTSLAGSIQHDLVVVVVVLWDVPRHVTLRDHRGIWRRTDAVRNGLPEWHHVNFVSAELDFLIPFHICTTRSIMCVHRDQLERDFESSPCGSMILGNVRLDTPPDSDSENSDYLNRFLEDEPCFPPHSR